MVVTKENHSQVSEMGRLMKGLGVNHVKYAPLITTDTYAYHSSFKDEVTKELYDLQNKYEDDRFRIVNLYTGDFEDSVFFERQYSKCPIKEFVCVIGANSKVYFCHDKAYLSDGCIGDLNKQSLLDLWKSEETTKLFAAFDARKICAQHCVYDSRNKLINSFLDMDINHINFV